MNIGDRRQSFRNDSGGLWSVGSKLSVALHGRRYAVEYLSDLSVTGASIAVPLALEAGTPMKFIFQSDEFVVDLYSHAVWCDSCGGAGDGDSVPVYRAGVKFDARDENLVLFYLAMRAHLAEMECHAIRIA
jgi:hypothetical protein